MMCRLTQSVASEINSLANDRRQWWIGKSNPTEQFGWQISGLQTQCQRLNLPRLFYYHFSLYSLNRILCARRFTNWPDIWKSSHLFHHLCIHWLFWIVRMWLFQYSVSRNYWKMYLFSLIHWVLFFTIVHLIWYLHMCLLFCILKCSSWLGLSWKIVF